MLVFAAFFFLLCAELFPCAPEVSYQVAFTDQRALREDDTVLPTVFKVSEFRCSMELEPIKKELELLLGVVPGAFVTREQFVQGVERLAQKNCFSEGIFRFFHCDEGTAIQFEATRVWLLRSVKVKGVTSNKDEYLRLYGQETGRPFSVERHTASVRAIEEYLTAAGYFEAQVTSALQYDETTKTVTVVIKIKRGKVSTITEASCEVIDKNKLLSPKELASLQKKSKQALHKKFCTQILLTKTAENLKQWLKELGFSEPVVTCAPTVLKNKRVSLLVTVTLEQRKKMFFFGNHFFSYADLSKRVADLSVKDFFLPSLIVAQELQAEYVKKGFWTATVESSDDGPDREYFLINEGKRCRVDTVMLKGMSACDPAWAEKMFFKKVVRTASFDQELVEEGKARCLAWYKKEGFWDAQVVRQEYLPVERKEGHYVLLLIVEEGRQRLLCGIDVLMFPGSYEEVPFYKELKDHPHSVPFPRDLISLQRTFLTKKLREQGYLHASLSHQLVEQPEGIRVVWRCTKGLQTTFGKTIVQGVSKIPYDRLLQLLSYQEGQLWDKERVQQSLTTLRSFDVFERVSLHTSFQDSSNVERDMVLVVKDDDPFEVKVRMGFAQVSKNFYFKKGSTYKAGGSFIWKNPRARADRFAIDVDYNRFEKRINASYSVPFLFDYPVATTFKVYANKYIQPVYIGSSQPLYQVLQQGFLVGVSKKTGPCDLGLTTGFDWMETNDISYALARAINFKVDLVDKKIPYFFIEPMVYANFLDEALNPTRGFFGLATVKGMFPFKESSFLVKVLAEQGTFIPLAKTVLAIRFRAGHIFRREFSAVMPPERFYLGGPFSVRSYLQDHCPPLGIYDNEGTIQYVPQGGKTMFNANFELRIPVNGQTVWGALFQDFGILVEDVRTLTIESSHPLAGTGFGVRYMTPVGPLRFDIGWKWRKERPEEPAYAWFLTFGNAF